MRVVSASRIVRFLVHAHLQWLQSGHEPLQVSMDWLGCKRRGSLVLALLLRFFLEREQHRLSDALEHPSPRAPRPRSVYRFQLSPASPWHGKETQARSLPRRGSSLATSGPPSLPLRCRFREGIEIVAAVRSSFKGLLSTVGVH